MKIFYVESECLTVGGEWSPVVLCWNDDKTKVAFKQDFEHRAFWTPIEFKTPVEALQFVRANVPHDSSLLLFEDCEIWCIDGNFIAPTSMKITIDNLE